MPEPEKAKGGLVTGPTPVLLGEEDCPLMAMDPELRKIGAEFFAEHTAMVDCVFGFDQ